MTKIAKFLLVGIFIFSGLIKLNDPIGTQLKLEEYFDVFSVDFAFMAGFWKFWIPYALILSILLSSLEIVLAIALALNYRIKQTLYAFVGILAFFGFLTFYSAYFNKVTDRAGGRVTAGGLVLIGGVCRRRLSPTGLRRLGRTSHLPLEFGSIAGQDPRYEPCRSGKNLPPAWHGAGPLPQRRRKCRGVWRSCRGGRCHGGYPRYRPRP